MATKVIPYEDIEKQNNEKGEEVVNSNLSNGII